ncbi:tRNA dimethylallyltransferase [Buchnera aphidicola (Nipponaphis monzeni)]|uniref:tRNA dimethylallyltransferase n=1 Tax=Buchnera aphidicola (Nipponaphis monzeni) TaxID=2495405 RepID=A0A455TAX0_9GAMM|nr:tRNA dimethylallyltransferase [Buchnera aphidicola (Nipponaphis monzeni)]
MKKKFPIVIFLMGPTASGKTALAVNLQKIIPVELISVDSKLIYKEMNIGTAKIIERELNTVTHRLIDIKNPNELYSVADFYYDALKEIKKVISLGKIPLLVGGTMLYFKILLNGLAILPKRNIALRTLFLKEINEKGNIFLYKKLIQIDPLSANKIHPNDIQRILRALEVYFLSGYTLSEQLKVKHSKFPYNLFQFSIIPSNKEWLINRIQNRFKKMIEIGFEEEVKQLINKWGLTLNSPSMRCIGYSQMWLYIHKKINYNDMVLDTILSTNKLAKHQITWLRKWEDIHYLESSYQQYHIKQILNIINL